MNVSITLFSQFYQSCADGQGVLLGSFRTLQHLVRGDVYAIDEKTIRIENFRYDGTGISKLAFLFMIMHAYEYIAIYVFVRAACMIGEFSVRKCFMHDCDII